MRTNLTLDKVAVTAILMRLARSKDEGGAQLYAKLMGSWGHRPDRERVVVPFSTEELATLQGLGLPEGIVNAGMVSCTWRATYRHPSKPKVEVVIHSNEKPPKKRAFAVAGGTARLERVNLVRINTNKEAAGMATKSRKKKAVEEDELDELEGLEELDDLEDLEDEEDEDVDDDEPEDEDDEEEEEAPKPRSRSKKKAAPAKKRSRKAVVEEDDEDDEDDEDEEETPARKKGRARQASAKTKAKSSTAKKKGTPVARELPAGKYGPEDIASEVGCDSRAVRVFLRAHADEFPKDEESFRYAFNKRDFQRAVKMLKKQRSE